MLFNVDASRLREKRFDLVTGDKIIFVTSGGEVGGASDDFGESWTEKVIVDSKTIS